MKALTYIRPGRFELIDKPVPEILDPRDAIVKVSLSSICSSDLHILNGSVPQARFGITVGHEMVGIVEAVGSEVNKVFIGDRVADKRGHKPKNVGCPLKAEKARKWILS